MTIQRHGVGKAQAGGKALPFAKAVEAGGFVFVSGQVATDATGEIVACGIVEQTRQTLDNIKAILAGVGLDLSAVVKATVWLDDAREFWSFNKVYAEYFGADLPARSCVQSTLVSACKVEVEVIAYRSPE
jgi:reactive intermediate/imine deaminase